MNYILGLVFLLCEQNIIPVVELDGNKLPATIHINNQRERYTSVKIAAIFHAPGKYFTQQERSVTAMDLGYGLNNKIYVTESLTEKIKQLFRECLNVKKMKNTSLSGQ